MVLLFVFAMTLLVAVLLSGLAERTILSTAVLFLAAGFVLGGLLNAIEVNAHDENVKALSEFALFSVLFTDGMRVSLPELRNTGALPGRALFLGLPLSFAMLALPAHFIVGLPWDSSLLLSAALSPTDPVFAAALVGRKEVPLKLRHLLNVESGMNDGLALPVVIILIEVIGDQPLELSLLLEEVALGVVLGAVIPLTAILLERSSLFSSARLYQPLNAVAIGLLILGATSITGANEFLGAFVGGIVLASAAPHLQKAFNEFGELISELLKLAAILLFGALITTDLLSGIGVSGYVFVALALLAIRPLSLGIALFRSDLSFPEWATAAWFGPKGFAAVVYGLLILESGSADSEAIFALIAVVVFVSIIVHSSTDVLAARILNRLAA